jgi:diketogulonate reductase-like aldo/keto reductase
MIHIEKLKGVIPIFGLGTWLMGGAEQKDTSFDKENIQIIRSAIKLGITHIDTAESYGDGYTEELVGKAIKGIEREKLFIVSKVKRKNLHYNDVISAAKRSMKRMGIDYIDLYLIHWPDPCIPLKETMKAMDYLIKENLVRYIGVSNFSVPLLKEAKKYSENKIITNQIEYNLLKREAEYELLPYCQKNDIILTAYRCLALGQLAKPGYKILDDLANKYDKTQAQISINWVLSHKNVIPIVKTNSIKHLKENIGSIGWKIKRDDIQKLNNIFKIDGNIKKL